MRKPAALILTAIMLLITTIPAYASGDMPLNTDYNHGLSFEKTEFIKNNFTIANDKSYIVPENGTLRVEEGAVLYIYGSLEVKGTLKNYGKIIIGDAGSGKVDSVIIPGNLTVKDKLINNGEIEVKAATFNCSYQGEIINKGTINLVNHSNENITLVYINGLVTEAGTVRSGLFTNEAKAVINVDITKGRGFIISKNATFINNGSYNKANK